MAYVLVTLSLINIFGLVLATLFALFALFAPARKR